MRIHVLINHCGSLSVEGSGEGKSNAQKPKRQPTVDISEDALKGMTEDERKSVERNMHYTLSIYRGAI